MVIVPLQIILILSLHYSFVAINLELMFDCLVTFSMKKFIYKLIDFYLIPFNLNSSLGLFGKHRIMQYNEHFLATVDMINRQVRNSNMLSDVIIDIGAYNGSTCIFFAKHFPNAGIIGFEPNPGIYKKAQEQTSNLLNISVFPFALDKEEGEKDFFISDNSLSSSLNAIRNNTLFNLEERIKVTVKTLDQCLEDVNKEILLIKLDAQGSELNILKGSKMTLKKTRFILTEMNNNNLYENGCQYYELDEFLRKNNFSLVNITSGYNYAGITEYDALYRNNLL